MIAVGLWAMLYGSEVADGYIIAGLVTVVGVLITFLGWLGTTTVRNGAREEGLIREMETLKDRLDAHHDRISNLEHALLGRGGA